MTWVLPRTDEPTIDELRADMRGIVRIVERTARIQSVRAAVAIAKRTGSTNVIAPLDGLLELLCDDDEEGACSTTPRPTTMPSPSG